MEKILTESAQNDRDNFDYSIRDQGCTCFISAPCMYCTHPGNPYNQNDDESCWEDYIDNTCKFFTNQHVLIRRRNSVQKGIIEKRSSVDPYKYSVVMQDGSVEEFHESKLVLSNFLTSTLHPTQEVIRHSVEELHHMVDFVKKGGRFNFSSLAKYSKNKSTSLIAIMQFEDGAFYIRDGFHRVMAIYLGRPNKLMYSDEYIVENLTYERMMHPKISVGYYTPFDPRVEVRIADFTNFKSKILQIIKSGNDPCRYIRENKDMYVRKKMPYHETVETFVNNWF